MPHHSRRQGRRTREHQLWSRAREKNGGGLRELPLRRCSDQESVVTGRFLHHNGLDSSQLRSYSHVYLFIYMYVCERESSVVDAGSTCPSGWLLVSGNEQRYSERSGLRLAQRCRPSRLLCRVGAPRAPLPLRSVLVAELERVGAERVGAHGRCSPRAWIDASRRALRPSRDKAADKREIESFFPAIERLPWQSGSSDVA